MSGTEAGGVAFYCYHGLNVLLVDGRWLHSIKCDKKVVEGIRIKMS